MVAVPKQGQGTEAYRKLRRPIEVGEEVRELDVAQRLTEPRSYEVAGMTRGPVREAAQLPPRPVATDEREAPPPPFQAQHFV